MINRVFNERVILVDILALIFGISSWVEYNGIWVQTPILVQRLPEEWKLSSYIIIITQIANIGPIIYSILKSKFSLKAIEVPTIHLSLILGAIACVLLSLFWNQISVINGSKYSLAFLGLTTMLAVVDCTTPLLYIPFMAHFKPKYLMSYLIGQNLSTLIPSVVALIQGVGGNHICVNSTTSPNTTVPQYPEPRFSVSVFFLIFFCVVLMSWLSFTLLNHLTCFQSERVSISDTKNNKHLKPLKTGSKTDMTEWTGNGRSVKTKLNIESNGENISQKSIVVLMAGQAYICFLCFGVLPSIQSYSCMPYGSDVYHMAVTLNGVANSVACIIAFFISLPALRRTLPIIIGLGSVCALYITVISLLSPTPPFQHSLFGKVIIVFTWISFSSLISYSRASIASILRNTSTGHKLLYYCGVFTQIGAIIGAILIFMLISFTNLFVASNPCPE